MTGSGDNAGGLNQGAGLEDGDLLNKRCVLEAFLLGLGSSLNHKSGNVC